MEAALILDHSSNQSHNKKSLALINRKAPPALGISFIPMPTGLKAKIDFNRKLHHLENNCLNQSNNY